MDACGHLEPFGHGVALTDEDFFFQRPQRVRLLPGHYRFQQVFGTVAVQGHEAGVDGRCGHA